jgi:hypothetical protein
MNRSTTWQQFNKDIPLKFPITVRSITTEIYECKSKGAPMNIIDHNAHAWTSVVTIFPQNRSVKVYNGDVFDFIK